MKGFYHKIDTLIIATSNKINIGFAKISIFIIFCWFGFLETMGESPANPLVKKLMEETLFFLNFEQFIIFFGLFEIFIAVIFIIPKCERVAIMFLFIHMFTTALPLFILPSMTWQTFGIPTIEGQYIIKNLAIIGLAISIASHLRRHKQS